VPTLLNRRDIGRSDAATTSPRRADLVFTENQVLLCFRLPQDSGKANLRYKRWWVRSLLESALRLHAVLLERCCAETIRVPYLELASITETALMLCGTPYTCWFCRDPVLGTFGHYCISEERRSIYGFRMYIDRGACTWLAAATGLG
jgi:hypothetical protein